MKRLSLSLVVLFGLLFFAGCIGKTGGKNNPQIDADTVVVPDTGFTGIKQVMQAGTLLKEITYKNGVRQGETRTYTSDGRLNQTFWYENNLRQDSGRWYYAEGEVFRATPYINDTVQGIAVQYYRGGQVRAKMGYDKGLRTPFFQEYNKNGLLYKEYPEIVATVTDNYNTNGTYRIDLSLSQKNQNVYFYRGGFTDNRFDTAVIEQLQVNNSQASIVLRKTGSPSTDTLGVIASILTPFRNRYITTKTIKLPYNDLK